MEVIYELSEQHIKQLHQLYQSAWWAKGRSYEDTKKCVEGSQICIGLVSSDDKLVGFVRVVTDYIFKALLFDVIVCDTQQGKGLGSKLVSLVKENEKLQSVKHFELYCLEEMEAFYVRYGFTSDLGDFKFMRFTNA